MEVVEKKKRKTEEGTASNIDEEILGKAPDANDPSLSRPCSKGKVDHSDAPLHFPSVSQIVKEQLEQLEQYEQQAALDKDIPKICI